MKYDILTVGFPMVEIMRKERNVPFDVPADFTGPYPSADTCIMANNAPGHLKGHLTGNHCVFEVQNHEMKRRFAQEIYLCEFDGPQERTISVIIMGE